MHRYRSARRDRVRRAMARRADACRRDSDGYTLIEVVVTLGLLAITLLPLASVFYGAESANTANREYGDAFAGIHRILKDGPTLCGREMMERGEHGSQALQVARNARRINRVRVNGNVILGFVSHTLERSQIWVLVGKPNLKAGRAAPKLWSFEPSRKV